MENFVGDGVQLFLLFSVFMLFFELLTLKAGETFCG